MQFRETTYSGSQFVPGLLQLLRRKSWLSCRNNSTATHYSVLGVCSSATKAEIKSAFLSLSKKHHPDVNQGSNSKLASQKFTRIIEAYTVLIDPAKRSLYDQQLYGVTPHPHFTSGPKSKVDERFDFYKYDPRANAYTYARAYNYYDLSDAEWKKVYSESVASVPRKNNFKFLHWLVLLMVCGSTLHSYRIYCTHKNNHQKSTEKTRKLQATYDAVRERSKNSNVQQQLARLTQHYDMDNDVKKIKNDSCNDKKGSRLK